LYGSAGEPTEDSDAWLAIRMPVTLELHPIRWRAWTIDAPFRETVAAIRRHREAGVLVVEMEAAASAS
jgi:hypothetical protein